jgi:4-amino-4-deoxy-L-arabinose transferase-like glycosyltransferase
LTVCLLAFCLHLFGNDRASLWDRDEPRYAGCTREMRASGDWLNPHFNAEPRYHKPVLIYWLMSGAMGIAGESAFGARLVSVLMGTATCVAVWGLGRRLFSERVGLWAGMMAATTPLLVYNAKSATTDATLTFFIVMTMWALWELHQRVSWRWSLVFWLGLSLATLTKGPVGVCFVVLAGIVSWLWSGLRAGWSRLSWKWGPALYVLLTAPWFIAIGVISQGRFYDVAMGRHVIERMTSPMETHGGFPGFYVILSMGLLFPWSAFVPGGFLAAWRERRAMPAVGFLAGWVVGPLIMLELIRTKLIHYYLPAVPAIVLLAAWWVDRVAASDLNIRRWPLGRLATVMVGLVGIGIVAVLVGVAWVGGGPVRLPSLVMAVVAGGGCLWALERLLMGATWAAVKGLAATWGVVLALAGGWLLPAVEPYRLTQKVARVLRAEERATGAAAWLGDFKPPGIVWEMGRPIPVIDKPAEFVESLERGGPVVTVLMEPGYAQLAKDPRLEIEERGTVSGLDIERGRWHTVRVVQVRARGGSGEGVARSAEEAAIK